MKILVFSVITFFFGILLQNMYNYRTISQLRENNAEKEKEVIYLTDSLKYYFNRIKYVDLDKRLYTPYDDKTIFKHYEDTVINFNEKFLVKHDIEIKKLVQ